MKNLPDSNPNQIAVPNHERRNATIRLEFARQQARGVKSAYIIGDLAYRYFLSENTIASIVWHRGRYAIRVVPTQNAVTA